LSFITIFESDEQRKFDTSGTRQTIPRKYRYGGEHREDGRTEKQLEKRENNECDIIKGVESRIIKSNQQSENRR
jgi:hypothetical protein